MIIEPPEIILVDDDADEVSCDGGGGALGHPKVWYVFAGQDSVECGYCDRCFIRQSAAHRFRDISSAGDERTA